MKRVFIIFIILLSAQAISGQDLREAIQESPYVYIYELNTQEATKTLKKGIMPLEKYEFEVLYDSIPTEDLFDYEINRPGYYLFVWIEGDQLYSKFVPVRSVNIFMERHPKLIYLSVTDSLGDLITADVGLKGRNISFDKSVDVYHFRSFNNSRLLSINYNGFTNYFLIDGDKRGIAPSYISRRILHTIISPFTPIVNTIRYGYPQGWIAKVVGLLFLT